MYRTGEGIWGNIWSQVGYTAFYTGCGDWTQVLRFAQQALPDSAIFPAQLYRFSGVNKLKLYSQRIVLNSLVIYYQSDSRSVINVSAFSNGSFLSHRLSHHYPFPSLCLTPYVKPLA